MRTAMKTLTGMVTLFALSLPLTACGTNAGGADAKTKKVLYLLPTLDDEAYSREAAGARVEAKKHPGIKLDVQAGPKRSDPTQLIAKVEDAITKQYSTIIVDPGGFGDQLAPALGKALAAGVKVESVVQPVPRITPTVAITFDQRPAYVAAGEYMGKLVPGGGELGVVACGIGNKDMDSRRAGFAAGLPSNIRQVQIGETACDPTKARKLVENMLTAHPNLKAIFSDTDIALLGGIQALKAAGKDLAVIGGDGQTANLKLIAKGDVQDASTRYPSETFGALAVRTAADLAAGRTVPASVTVPNLPLITKSNAADVLKEIDAIRSGTAAPELP